MARAGAGPRGARFAGSTVGRALGAAAALLSVVSFAPSTSFAGLFRASPDAPRGDLTAMHALYKPAPAKYGSARYKQYSGFVYRRKRIPFVRLRLDRWGTGKRPFYKIKATFQKSTCFKSGRFYECIGFWDPMKEVDHPFFFKLKADRAVYWLRIGAQPTDMVASLLDRAGIIRRLGPLAKRGEWEWRIPPESGPEAPEGWSYDGPHSVTWGNEPTFQKLKGRRLLDPHPKMELDLPLIERYGFQGYTKVPIDFDAARDPVAGTALLEAFSNTDLPGY